MKSQASLSPLLFAITLYSATWGCAVQQPSDEITDLQQRFEFQEFSILPPQGTDWFVRNPPKGPESQDLRITFFKSISITHTFVAFARAGSIGEGFENKEKSLRRLGEIAQNKGKDVKVVKSNVALDQSLKADCLRYDIVSEVREVPQYEDHLFLLHDHGYICLHPTIPKYVVNVEYSERHLASEQPIQLESEREPYLRSLVFK